MSELARSLEHVRRTLGVTASAFAEKLGIDQTNYSAVLYGRRSLPFKARCRAFKLGVPAELLLALEEEFDVPETASV